MARWLTLYQDRVNYFVGRGAVDQTTGDPIPPTAVGGVTLRALPDGETPGDEVGGTPWPISLAWDDVRGGFVAALPDTAVLDTHTRYELEVTIDHFGRYFMAYFEARVERRELSTLAAAAA